MKFNRIISKILLETLQHPTTFGKSSYTQDPEESLATLQKAYDFLKNYDMAKYNHKLPIGQNKEDRNIIDAVESITVIMRDSKLNTYRLGNKNVNREQLAKDVIRLASRFGQTDFTAAPKNHELLAAMGPIETRKKVNTKKGCYMVTTAGNSDLDGNPIQIGTALKGSDYRLSTFVDSKSIKNYGGIPKLHECYLELFNIVGLRWQPYRRSSKGAERLRGVEDMKEEPIYWWGENCLPYRSLITTLNGIVRKVPRPGDEDNQDPKGGIQWTTDRIAGLEKPRPFSIIGDQKLAGAVHGEPVEGVFNYGKSLAEIKNKMESSDFDPIRKEHDEIQDLKKRAKDGDEDALQILDDALERHKKYEQLVESGNSKEIIRIYKERASKYFSVYNDPNKFKINARRPPLVEETKPDDAWPYFHIFQKNPANKKYKLVPTNAQRKYEFLYPRNIGEIANIFYKDKTEE